jgi:hypothetical protein
MKLACAQGMLVGIPAQGVNTVRLFTGCSQKTTCLVSDIVIWHIVKPRAQKVYIYIVYSLCNLIILIIVMMKLSSLMIRC